MKIAVAYGWVALGGALGAMARLAVSRAAAAVLGIGFPYGTFLVNMSGSLVLGALTALLLERAPAHADALRLMLAIGFLGSYTTFSTFEYESHALFEDGRWLFALGNLLGSVFVGLVAIRLGIVLARRWG